MQIAAYHGPPSVKSPDVVIRPVRMDDVPMMQSFVQRLSARSRRLRFFSSIAELSVWQLDRLTRCRRDGLALVALSTRRPQDTAIIGEVRYVVDPATPREAEIAIAIADAYQRQGLGTRLMNKIAVHAAGRGVQRLWGVVLAENQGMLKFAERLGFHVRDDACNGTTVIASLALDASR